MRRRSFFYLHCQAHHQALCRSSLKDKLDATLIRHRPIKKSCFWGRSSSMRLAGHIFKCMYSQTGPPAISDEQNRHNLLRWLLVKKTIGLMIALTWQFAHKETQRTVSRGKPLRTAFWQKHDWSGTPLVSEDAMLRPMNKANGPAHRRRVHQICHTKQEFHDSLPALPRRFLNLESGRQPRAHHFDFPRVGLHQQLR